MSTISTNVSFESEYLLSQIGESEVKSWLESHGYACMMSSEASKYVNIEKSMGTNAFYKLLVDAIESGQLSLEMIVGHIATRKLMQKAENVSKKII
jgi:hypothetical protein